MTMINLSELWESMLHDFTLNRIHHNNLQWVKLNKSLQTQSKEVYEINSKKANNLSRLLLSYFQMLIDVNEKMRCE